MAQEEWANILGIKGNTEVFSKETEATKKE